MNSRRIIVYGAGGHGKVVADILLVTKESSFVGFVDDCAKRKGTTVLGSPVLGDGEWLRREAQEAPFAVVLGVGDNRTRRLLARRCELMGVELLTLVHPTATVSRSARLGRGTVVMARAVINPDARLGQGVIVNTGAVVEHDVVVGDYAHVAPRAAMAGASRLGALSQLGLGAVVKECVSIGVGSVVGAGAVVVLDIPDRVIAIGVPAKVHRSIGRSCSKNVAAVKALS